MKIAFIGTRGYPYVYSGYETFVREVAERMVEMNLKVRVYCHRGLFEQRPKKVNDIELVYLPSIETKILSQLSHSFLAMIHCCISRSVTHIVVVNTANGPFGLISRMFRKPTLINLDGLEWLRPKWKGLGAWYFYLSSWLSTRLFDRLINDSEEMRKIYLEKFGVDSEVIAYGAKLRKSRNPAMIERWGLQKHGYYLIVGRLIPDNNADLILRGFMKTKSKYQLVIVGDVPYKDEFAEKIKAWGSEDSRVVLTGYVTNPDELAELYHNCFCYLHGHEFGGTNPTMLKAMAYGCAILALDTRFSREMLQGERFGFYFQKSLEEVISSLNRLEEHPEIVGMRRQEIHGALTEKYDWDVVTQKYVRVLRTLLRPKSP